jgi:hypothetical protein
LHEWTIGVFVVSATKTAHIAVGAVAIQRVATCGTRTGTVRHFFLGGNMFYTNYHKTIIK